jgi:prepilin-type N-terminal cleavage/methylation domain-containing protein
MRRHAAVTIIELLVAITVVAMIAAITYPVVSRAMDAARVGQCISNLRQIGAAIEMYRSDHDGVGAYGHWVRMGLPPGLDRLKVSGHLDVSQLRCRGVPNRNLIDFDRYFTNGWVNDDYQEWAEERGAVAPPWIPYVMQYRDEAILVFDVNHQFGGRPLEDVSIMEPARAIGLCVGGHVRVVVSAGTPHEREWWHQE